MFGRYWITIVVVALWSAIATAGPVESLCERFSGFDQNGDGIVELAQLDVLASRGDGGPHVLLLVEPRLLAPLDGAEELRPRLERWADDLAREGFRATVIAAELGQSDLHQDGRYVLALRELFRAVERESELAGALLVGRFADAYLVRTCNWRRQGDLVLHKKTDRQANHQNVRFVRRVPEEVACRAEIVLSDLDGRWEDLYVQPPTRVPSTLVVFGDSIPEHGGPCLDLQEGGSTFADFFHIADGSLEISAAGDASESSAAATVTLLDTAGNRECSADDLARPNTIARADIVVSRLDAKGIALRPRADIVGADGRTLLDEAGRPQEVRFASADDVPHWRDGLWEPDPALERRLLADYFDRNHAYRTGEAQVAWRPSSIACDLRSGYAEMSRAADDWSSQDEALRDIAGRPTLVHFADWIEYPALLRTVRAHSDPYGSMFKRASAAPLDERLDHAAWCWTPQGDALVPSLSSACRGGKLDWFLLRSLWEQGALAEEPAFYHHMGCHGISPGGAHKRPYDHPGYGLRQGAESLLLFGNGLALVGRSKVFYDEPRGFAAALGAGKNFGDAWREYYELESKAASWREAGGDIGRKRSYFWSVLGDWTLTLDMGRPK